MTEPAHTLITNRYAGAADYWLGCKDQFEVAKTNLAEAKDQLVSEMSEDDGPFVVIRTDRGEVAVTDKDRRSFDADLLIKLTKGGVEALIAAGVIEFKVDPTSFDKAVANGTIPAKTVSKVVSSTSFVDVRKH